jgi:hypothetical protein
MALNTTIVALVFDMPELDTTRARIVAVTTINGGGGEHDALPIKALSGRT